MNGLCTIPLKTPPADADIVGIAGGTMTWAGDPLDLAPSLALRNHSSTDLAWDSSGSGPAPLLLQVTD